MSLNWAHIHLIINHIPVIAIPIAIIFLLASNRFKNETMKRVSLVLIVLLSLATVGVYFTGEPAEEVIEHMNGIEESYIESHEDSAKISLVASILMGVFALAALTMPRAANFMGKFVTILAIIATMCLGYTAYLGGQIHHTEIRD